MRRLRLFTAADPADPYLDEPPPGPYDYPYGYSDATLADLDFTDLPRQRPPGRRQTSTSTSAPYAHDAKPTTLTPPH